MKRMIDDKDYNKTKTDLNTTMESVTTLEGKNYYTISIETNSLIITEESEADEDNI